MGFKGTSHLLGARYLKKSLSGHQMTVDTMELLGEAHWLKLPTLARHHSNHLHELFYEGGPGKEHEANKPPSTTRVQEKSKGGARCLPPPRILLTGIPLGWVCHQETEQLAKDNLETNPITIKPETANHVAEKFSWVPLPYCSPPRHPIPNKTSCFVSMCVPQCLTRAHFQALAGVPLPATELKLQWPQEWKTICKNKLEKSQMEAPGDSDSKKSACNVRDQGSIPGSGRSPGEVNSNSL